MNTKDDATGRWREILIHFGVEDNYLIDKHGPCPLCGGGDRFRWDDKDGSGSYFCSQCGPGSGFDLAMKISGQEFSEIAKEIDNIVGGIKRMPEKKKPDPRPRLKAVAKKLIKPDLSSPVAKYLSNRNLMLNDKLKYHQSMAYYEAGEKQGEYPAMVALFESQYGEASTYHITYLTDDGKKAPVDSVRKILPPVIPMAGGAIRLSKVQEHIGIAEGIETAMAVYELFGVSCWAASNTGMLEAFIPPNGVKKVTIYADNDKNFAGQKSAYILANRLAGSHEVEVVIPKSIGTDFADEIND